MKLHRSGTAKKQRQAARRQAMAAVFLTVCSMFSPAPDLRPKPLLPVRYQRVQPAGPPGLGLDMLAPGDEPPVPGTAASAPDTADALARAGLPPHHPFRSEETKARYLALYDARAREWPVPCETIHVHGVFGETCVRVSGPAGAPPLVLLHGISSNSLAWMPNVAALAGRHRVYAQYASARPERLCKLVLVAPAGTVLPLAPEWMARAVACAIPLRFFTRSFLGWLLHDLAQRPSFDDVVAEAYTTLRCLAPRTMVPPTVLTDEELRRLAVPSLYVVGQNEKICSPLLAIERLKAVAPRITTRLVAGAGHDLTLVKAAEVNRAVLDFLAP